MLVGVLVSVPLAVLPFYPEEASYSASFIFPALASLVLGFVVCLFSRHDDNNFNWQYTMQNGSLTVLFAWSYGFLAGALPFVISGKLTFVQALFEAVSGWTTTGLSVMDVTVTPHIFLFHRSFMQFCGGMGFIMVMLMLIQGKQSMSLYNAEGHPDRLTPNLKRTAQTVFLMFTAFLSVGTLLYQLAGMNLFDSITHSMCALSTGGFSTKLNSIGEYESLYIEAVTIVLMLIGTTNFAVLLLLIKGKFRQVFRVSEIRFMLVLLLVFTALTTLALSAAPGMGIGASFRNALFNTASALSTTGYSTMSYTNWPQSAIGMLILVMLVGGGIGSTAGGIKLSRVYLLLRAMFENIRKRLTPARAVSAPYYFRAQGKAHVDNALIIDTVGFISSYLSIFIIGSLLLTWTANCALVEAMFEFASALGTVGLSIGITTPMVGTPTLIVEMVGMILGRLEIFIVLIGVYSGLSMLKQAWRK